MNRRTRQQTRYGTTLVGIVALGLMGVSQARGQAAEGGAGRASGGKDRGADLPRSVAGRDTVYLPKILANNLGVRTEPARAATRPGSLVLRGVLAIDPAHRIRIRPRFGGEVVDVGMTPGAEGTQRRLRPGDRVTRGQLLAIVWSSELSQKKNELLNALSRLYLERETFGRLSGLHKEKVISSRDYQEAKRELEQAEIETAQAERSLRARGSTAAEIAAVQAEAETVRARGSRTPFDPEKSWARFAIHSPIDGRILDARAAEGDTVDTDEVIFQLADLRRLLAQVTIDEADLPAVEALPRPARWALRVEGLPDNAPRVDAIEIFGVEIDPGTHTTTLTGIVENDDQRLRPGQSLTATIDLPLDPTLVEVPDSARLTSDGQTMIFSQPVPDDSVFVLRRLRAVRVGTGFLIVHSDPRHGLQVGERVVVAGADKLKAILDGAAPMDEARWGP